MPETSRKLPTCVCGSTQFEERQTSLPLIDEASVTTVRTDYKLWLRICTQCSQVTLWNKKSVAPPPLGRA